MQNNIILSICIPTYNRANYLKTTILSIVNQHRFKDSYDVEIIICDNCSEDDTKHVCLSFVEIYGVKLRYYRNEINIKDSNFEKVLSYGKGSFLKLNNDTLIHQEGSLDELIKTINENNQNILFFSNGVLKENELIYCENFNFFIKKASYFTTWIGAFGIWKQDFELIKDFNRYSSLQLVQTDVLFRLFKLKKAALINNKKLFISYSPPKKGGYDLITVFLDNYIFLLYEQVKLGLLTTKVFRDDKKKLLYYHICPWYVNIKIDPNQFTFTLNDFYSKIYLYYKKDLITIFTFIFKCNLMFIRQYIKKFE